MELLAKGPVHTKVHDVLSHFVSVCLLLCPQNEVCFITGGEQSSCCAGYTCTADSSVKVEASLAEKVMGGLPGVCRKVSATLSA